MCEEKLQGLAGQEEASNLRLKRASGEVQALETERDALNQQVLVLQDKQEKGLEELEKCKTLVLEQGHHHEDEKRMHRAQIADLELQAQKLRASLETLTESCEEAATHAEVSDQARKALEAQNVELERRELEAREAVFDAKNGLEEARAKQVKAEEARKRALATIEDMRKHVEELRAELEARNREQQGFEEPLRGKVEELELELDQRQQRHAEVPCRILSFLPQALPNSACHNRLSTRRI